MLVFSNNNYEFYHYFPTIGEFLLRRLSGFHSDDWRNSVPMFGGISEDDWKARCVKYMSSSHKGQDI